MKITLNTKQQKVFDHLKEFIKKDYPIDTIILNGYAGTGKTLLVQEFASYLQKKKIKFSLLATTGRAAAVLRGKTDFPTSTIHGALYKFSKVDGDSDDIAIDAKPDEYGQMKLLFEPAELLEEDCIYIIDEASMLASESSDDSSFAIFGTGSLLPDLLHAIGRNKIILVGDPAQLPPVFQDASPAFDIKWLETYNRKVERYFLEEIMRTDKDNDILIVAEEVRKNIGKESFSKWIKLPALNRNNCKVLPDANTVFLEYYSYFLQFGPEGAIGIAHSNKACNHLNQFFRRRLYPNRNNLLEVGEILMVTQNNYLIPLVNGDFIKVLNIGEISEKCNLRFQNVKIEHLVSGNIYEIKLALDPLSQYVSNLSTDQQRNLMIDFSKRMRKKGIKANSNFYKDAMQKDVYLNSLRATYGYVITCHKSQGGEWENVFLFLDKGMYGYMSQDYMRKWWYTAITRAKKYLFLHREWWLN